MDSNCHFSSDAAAYLAGELSEREQATFDLHLLGCPECRANVESSRQLIGLLRTVPGIEPSRDLAPIILESLHEPAPRRTFTTWRTQISAIAATITLLAGGVALWQPETTSLPGVSNVAVADESSASISRALDWFCQHQEPDGSWNAAKWGGNTRFEIALTALPLIALLDEPQLTQERVAVINRATEYLRGHQNPDGTFGASFNEAPYVQSVTTLALLRAYQRQPSTDLRRTLDASLNVVLARQTADGAWGYQRSQVANLPITLWHKEVVELAAELGWNKAHHSLDRVTQWLAAQPALSAFTTDSTANAETDYHRAYFTVVSLRNKKTAEALKQLTAIRHSLVAKQADNGEESGTWNPTDQWSRAGGRIYSTALASLALR